MMTNLDGTVALAFMVVTFVNDLINVEITNSWADNSELCSNGVIKVKSAQDGSEGWQIHMKSSHRLSTVTSLQANIQGGSDGGYSYVLTNVTSNAELIAEQTFEVPFVACSSEADGQPPWITAEFYRNDEICPRLTPPPSLSSHYSMSVMSAIESQWNNAFQGYLKITPSVAVTNGWKIYLAFSRPLSYLNVTNATSVPSQGLMFILENTSWNSEISPGSSLRIDYVGHKGSSGHPTPCVTAVFTWQDGQESHPCGDIIVPSGYHNLEVPVTILHEWSLGFRGQINVTAPAGVRDGWQIVFLLKNSISLLEVYVVTANPTNGTKFTLRNKDYNKELREGSVTIIDFLATKERENDEVPCTRAVFMWAEEQPCPTVDPVPGLNYTNATVTILGQWNEGLFGSITVVVPVEIENGWQIRIIVSTAVTLVVPEAASTPASGTMFTLVNKDYNKKLTVGMTLSLSFTGTKEQVGSTVLCASAHFLW